MKILLLVAHGSRNSNANAEIEQLARKVEPIAKPEFAAVTTAFLEFAEPDIVGGIDQCVELGASQVTVVPYFLAAGNHVTRDIPAQLDVARNKYSSIDITQSPHIGSVEFMAQAVLSGAKQTSD